MRLAERSLYLHVRYAAGRVIFPPRNRAFGRQELREAYIEEMKKYIAEDLVFLDEAIFNEKTGWRYRGYGPQGERIQYTASTTRGDTYAVMAATTLSGWLPCSVLKKGYYNKDQFYQFITEFLIPCLKEAYGDAGKAVVRTTFKSIVTKQSAMLLKGQDMLSSIYRLILQISTLLSCPLMS
jgi:DDE superfamily endonuclease